MIKADLRLSAEEIEMALASNNANLARIHISLLKVVCLPSYEHSCCLKLGIVSDDLILTTTETKALLTVYIHV